LTPDRALVYSILQGGISALNIIKRKGIKSEDLFGDDVEIFELFEEFISKGRMPSLDEIALFTPKKIVLAEHNDLIDPDMAAEIISKRTLTKKLNDGLGAIADEITNDPVKARDDLGQLIRDTTWTQGNIQSTNSPSSIEEVELRYLEAEKQDGGLLGLPSPWKSLDEASLGLQNGEVTVVFAKRKLGKCAQKSTIVHDPITGREQTIEDLVKKGEGLVYTWDESKPITSVRPSAYVATGTKECLKFTFKSGRTLIVTPEHPFKTAKGWIKAEDLEVENNVACVGSIPAPINTVRMPEHEIKVLAYLMSDGGNTNKYSINYTKADQELIDDFDNALHQMSCRLSKHAAHYRYGVVRLSSENGHNKAIELCDYYKLSGKTSLEKTIPDAIFSLPDDQLGLFIGRYWSGDGTVEKSEQVSLSTGSKKLAFQMQHLLLRFGVQSKVRPLYRTNNKENEEREYYEVVVRKETIEQFKKHIKLIGPKARKLEKIEFSGLSRVGWLHTEEVNARPELLQSIGSALDYKFVFQRGHIFDTKSNRVRRKVFSAFCDVYDSSLKWTLDKNIWWDEIESIEPDGVHEVYDLTVDDTHCFVANDIIVHNTWSILAWANHIWQQSLKPSENILFVSMEMPPWQINRRLFAIRNKLDYALFRKGKLPKDQRERFLEWCKQQKEPDPSRPEIIVVGSDTVRTVSDLVGVAAQYRPKAVFIDGFYILGKDQKKQIWERTLENVQAIKLDAAINLNIPFVISTQLSGQVGKQDLDAEADAASYAKAIGDYADACYGIFADDAFKAAEKRVLRVMEAREFVPIDLQINFSQSRQDYSEIKVIGKKDIEFTKDLSIDTDLPDFNADDQLTF
jgi:intein/homing endonuclease